MRASDDGVLDGESQGSSLRELDTDYEQEAAEEEAKARPAPRKKSKARAGTSTKAGKIGAGRSAKGKGRAKEAEETTGTETEDSAIEQDEEEAAPPRKRAAKGRKSVRLPSPPDEMEVDDDGNVELETVEYEAPRDYEAPLRDADEDESPAISPRKRKAQVRRTRSHSVVRAG